MIGVVADDTTGANDIGLMFAKNNYSVKIVTYSEHMVLSADSDVLIVDTDSRLDSPEISYQKVKKATKALQQLGCSLYFKKTCSVFRGNIGSEFDAMLNALGEEFAVITLAFPKNGRQTVHGIHTVYGKLLEHSNFRSDPVHPMRQSHLVSILQEQTSRNVCHVDIEVVRQGADVLKKEIEAKREIANYCIVDAETQEDLRIIAEAVHAFPVLGGSSSIAEELPAFWGAKQADDILGRIAFTDENGVLVVSGSLTPQTREQTAYLASMGVTTVILDSRRVFSSLEKESEISRAVAFAAACLKEGKDVLVMADNTEETVAQTKEIGRQQHVDSLAVSKLVSAALAEVTRRTVGETGVKRLVVAGGDTSGTICRALGIEGNYVLKEIETGLPSGLAIGREMLIGLKSGSFGKPDFLARAIEHLKEIAGS